MPLNLQVEPAGDQSRVSHVCFILRRGGECGAHAIEALVEMAKMSAKEREYAD